MLIVRTAGKTRYSITDLVGRKRLTDYSFRLYMGLISLLDGELTNKGALESSMGWNRAKLNRAIRELDKQGLVMITRSDKGPNFLYVGNSETPVSDVEWEWENSRNA